MAKGCFPVCRCLYVREHQLIMQNYVALNRMQSVVHPIAMNTNENMLVCGMSSRLHLLKR
jgi:hypothetical protein